MGATEQRRKITIHKPDKYVGESFISMSKEKAGIALGKMTKRSAVNLYIYLMGNKSNYNFELSPTVYGKWLGFVDEKGEFLESKKPTVNDQIREGIKQLISLDYLVEKEKGVYDFYEGGIPKETLTENSVRDSYEKIPQENVTENSVRNSYKIDGGYNFNFGN